MRRPVRLLMAIPELDRGGPDRVFFELACRLSRDDFEIALAVSRRSGYYVDRLPRDIVIHGIPSTGRRLADRYPVVRMARLLKRLEPDVVLSTLRMNPTLGVAGLVARDVAIVCRVAVHPSAHRDDQARSSCVKAVTSYRIVQAALLRADIVVSQSSVMTADLVSSRNLRQKVVTIGNPIDPTWVNGRLAAAPVASLPGTPKLLAVGRLVPQKGFDVLLRAMPEILREHRRAHLTVVGSGPDAEGLRLLGERLGVSSSFSIVPVAENTFVYYAGADLLVAPSRWEGLSNVVIEALMVGLPVVTTRGSAAGQDLVTSNRLGRLVDPENVAGLAGAVCDALEADFDRAWIARDSCVRFGSDSVVNAYGDVLLRAVSTHRSGVGRGAVCT